MAFSNFRVSASVARAVRLYCAFDRIVVGTVIHQPRLPPGEQLSDYVHTRAYSGCCAGGLVRDGSGRGRQSYLADQDG